MYNTDLIRFGPSLRHPPRCSHKNCFCLDNSTSFSSLRFQQTFGFTSMLCLGLYLFFLITSEVLTGESHHAAFLWVAGHSSSHPKFLTLSQAIFWSQDCHRTPQQRHWCYNQLLSSTKNPHLSSSLICYFNLKTRTENITGWRNKKW